MKKIITCALIGMAVLGAGLLATPSYAIDFSRIDKEAPNEGYGAQYGGKKFDPKKMDEGKINPRILDEDKSNMKH